MRLLTDDNFRGFIRAASGCAGFFWIVARDRDTGDPVRDGLVRCREIRRLMDRSRYVCWCSHAVHWRWQRRWWQISFIRWSATSLSRNVTITLSQIAEHVVDLVHGRLRRLVPDFVGLF